MAHVLRHQRAQAHPALLVGLEAPDDAAIWAVDAARALVQTVDFFAPVVDDPYQFGAIAAANALSDIYAMGGKPFMALAIAGFPDDLPLEILEEILRGGAETVASVGVIVTGGHTVTDSEPKYGLCVSGWVDPRRILTKGSVHPGDALLLTKPLGAGIVTTAIKRELAQESVIATAVASMRRLNAGAATVIGSYPEIRACTDVTGFALAGHASEMAIASAVQLTFASSRLPLLPGVLDLAASGGVSGGTRRNRDFLTATDDAQPPRVEWDGSLTAEALAVIFDPQTSGGLLFAVPRSMLTEVIAEFSRHGEPVWEIGEASVGRGVRFEA